MPAFTTACPRNCYSTCSMLVTVENNRVTRIEAHPENRATSEGVCLKGLSYVERQYSADRIKTPLKRVFAGSTSQAFAPVGWDEALDEIASRLQDAKKAYGPQSVFYYAASGTKGWLNRIGARFWRLFGGYTGIYGDLCWPAGLEATRLTLGENKHNDPWDLANARLIVLWGKNAAETNIQQMRFIEQSIQQGGRLVVIDPRRTESAAHADLFIQPRPGSDGILALALGSLLVANGWIDSVFIHQHILGFEAYRDLCQKVSLDEAAQICGVPAAQIELLANWIGASPSVTINAGYGMQRYSNGGQTIRAMIALCAITGNIGKPGSGWMYANLQSQVFDPVKDPLDSFPPNQPDGIARISISTAKLGLDMAVQQDPPLKFLWVERGNPVPQNPQTPATLAAIRSLDFRVVVDELMTDTALEADIILPGKTLFEQTDVINAYWHAYIQLKQKIVEAPPQVKPESEIYWHLGLRLGFSENELENAGIPRPGQSEMLLSKMLSELNDQYGSHLSLDRLAEGPVIAPNAEPVAFSDLKFATPSGKIELLSAEAGERWNVDPLPSWTPPIESLLAANNLKKQFPLQLLTPNTKNSIHSQFHQLYLIKQVDPGPRLSIHSNDAASRGLQEGDLARVFNDRGELFLPVHIDEGIRPGCVACPNGYWVQHGSGVNVLSAARETDMGYGAAFHDNLVQVERKG